MQSPAASAQGVSLLKFVFIVSYLLIALDAGMA
jgi:hypothetical protein